MRARCAVIAATTPWSAMAPASNAIPAAAPAAAAEEERRGARGKRRGARAAPSLLSNPAISRPDRRESTAFLLIASRFDMLRAFEAPPCSQIFLSPKQAARAPGDAALQSRAGLGPL